MRRVAMLMTVAAMAACEGDGRDLVEDIRPVPAGVPVAVEAAAPNALIGTGMRTCYVAPEQQPGEVVVSKNTWSPNSPEQCLFLAPNNSWDLCSPTLHWYDGTMMNDTIKRVTAWVPSGKHLRIQLYGEWMFGAPMGLDKTYDGPWNVLETFSSSSTSSIRTTYW